MSTTVCGTCAYGADARNRSGQIDPGFVICEIKEAENRKRTPNRFQTMSGVSRMHYHRESCLHWKPKDSSYSLEINESPLPISPQATQVYIPPSHDISASPQKPTENQDKLNQLKLDVIQKDQMIQSLQFQIGHLSEQLDALKAEQEDMANKLKHAIYFDPAMTEGETNYFDILDVTLKDKPDEIKKSYYLKIKKFHPDRFLMLTQQLNNAYETLTDPEKRQAYIHKLKSQDGFS